MKRYAHGRIKGLQSSTSFSSTIESKEEGELDHRGPALIVWDTYKQFAKEILEACFPINEDLLEDILIEESQTRPLSEVIACSIKLSLMKYASSYIKDRDYCVDLRISTQFEELTGQFNTESMTTHSIFHGYFTIEEEKQLLLFLTSENKIIQKIGLLANEANEKNEIIFED